MPDPNPDALNFMLSRRSVPSKTLVHPAPDRRAVEEILTAGARVPDHKMLEPWRFIVLEDAALTRLASVLETRAHELELGAEKAEKARSGFASVPLSVTVVASPKPTDAIPEVEQTLSAGAACLSVLNAALAAGWGANWITGWMAFDRVFLERELGLQPTEFVAGFIHMGTPGVTPSERNRPELNAITQWVSK